MTALSSLASVSQNVSFHYYSQLVSLTLSFLVSQVKKIPTKLTLNSLCILKAFMGKLHRNGSEMLKLLRAVLVGSYLSKECGI